MEQNGIKGKDKMTDKVKSVKVLLASVYKYSLQDVLGSSLSHLVFDIYMYAN